MLCSVLKITWRKLGFRSVNMVQANFLTLWAKADWVSKLSLISWKASQSHWSHLLFSDRWAWREVSLNTHYSYCEKAPHPWTHSFQLKHQNDILWTTDLTWKPLLWKGVCSYDDNQYISQAKHECLLIFSLFS